MTTPQVIAAVEAWAAAVTGANTYDHAPTVLRKAIEPGLVLAELTRKRRSAGQYEQTTATIWEVRIWIFVDPGETPAETQAAANRLEAYVDQLGESLIRDKSLGNRVEAVVPEYDAGFDPPEMEYADGTVVRVATFRLTVGETTGG
jgi:hypothetical protein